MHLSEWALAAGVLLLLIAVIDTALQDLPLTRPMVYLVAGVGLSPAGASVLVLDPLRHAATLQALAEAGLLVSLFAVGLGLQPLQGRTAWRLPLKLATLSLILLIGLVTGLGVWALGLSVGASVLLGAILAPTDPVLASALQPQGGGQPHRLSLTLAAEGGINDGAALPFAALGLMLLGLDPRAPQDWALRDLVWSPLAGLAVGAALGAGVARGIVALRSRHGQAFGLDMFIGLGLIGTTYGLSSAVGGSGFLAVFAAGLAMGHVRRRGLQPGAAQASAQEYARSATGRAMRGGVQHMNEQLEKVCEMGLVLLIGALLPQVPVEPAAWWFVPLLLGLLRPLSVLPAFAGEGAGGMHLAMSAWFGIRGIGSLFYLMHALAAGLSGPQARTLLSLTVWTIAASIVLHGLTAGIAMRWFDAGQPGRQA